MIQKAALFIEDRLALSMSDIILVRADEVCEQAARTRRLQRLSLSDETAAGNWQR